MPNIRRTHQSTAGQRKLIKIGDRFGRYIVVGDEVFRGKKKQYAHRPVRCDCGTEKLVFVYNLIRGECQSCGCLKNEKSSERIRSMLTTHGGSSSRLYQTFHKMHDRCENHNTTGFSHYGGRGIKVCEEWKTFHAFREWALANGYRVGLTIERKDVNGDYTPDNCTWITRTEQTKNKTTTLYLTVFGETKRVFEWVNDPHCLVSAKTIQSRLRYGWSHVRAVTTPNRYHGSGHLPSGHD